ncbi:MULTISPECIES: class I SAM-dependent methyltransferase [unclassified Kitasatospora]|uniref:class I SAM-dependent methyltransferase n=1 Tax=unclassified Kitasatospora TaxID=2633591 RepID=UPI002473C2D6|nr:class I SAM-dependent methyltransferase [Kitasatospora sp. MAP12-44]
MQRFDRAFDRAEEATAAGRRPAGSAGYGPAADELAQQYESVTFDEVHRDALRWFPPAPSRIADIGAGTGRDAAALAELGHRVTAVEPTPELRAIGRRLHAGSAIDWVDDVLPALDRLAGAFDLVLLTAVWMHLDRSERLDAMRRIRELLADGGRVVITLRHGPVPPGRRMFDVTVAETLELAERFGLHELDVSGRADLHGRDGVSWSTVVLVSGEDH